MSGYVQKTLEEQYGHIGLRSNIYTVLIVFVLVAAICSGVWVAAPKQDRTVWRSSVILCLSMMFLMWAFTYLSQLHPLVKPIRSDLRPEK